MTNDKTVTMSREFKAGFTAPVGDCGKFEASIDVDSWGARIVVYGDTAEDAEQLRAEVMAKLAAPAVERQEQPTTDDTFIRGWRVGTRYFGLRMEAVEWIRTGQAAAHDTDTKLHPLYFANPPASPPAPVAVVLPDRLSWSGIASWKQRAEITAWNACLDKVKELNQ